MLHNDTHIEHLQGIKLGKLQSFDVSHISRVLVYVICLIIFSLQGIKLRKLQFFDILFISYMSFV